MKAYVGRHRKVLNILMCDCWTCNRTPHYYVGKHCKAKS